MYVSEIKLDNGVKLRLTMGKGNTSDKIIVKIKQRILSMFNFLNIVTPPHTLICIKFSIGLVKASTGCIYNVCM